MFFRNQSDVGLRTRASIKAITLCAVLAAMSTSLSAAPTDIVPRGSAINDVFSQLSNDDLLPGIAPGQFHAAQLRTREELARIFEHDLIDSNGRLKDISGRNAVIWAAASELEPELRADGIDFNSLRTDLQATGTNVGGFIQPKFRSGSGSSSRSSSSVKGIFDVAAFDTLSNSSRAVVSISNWAQDWRRIFYNDAGRPGDFSAFNEGYLDLHSRNGLDFKFGRIIENWGSGARGGTTLSDNAPPLDEMRVSFPFSLGAHAGRDYRYTQILSTFSELGVRKYLEARRVEYAFNPALNVDVQESFKSSASGSLLVSAVPFDIESANFAKVLHFADIHNVNSQFNYNLDFGASYAPTPSFRTYGRFFIDDMKSPLGSRTKTVPRKVAYQIGFSDTPTAGTDITAEYSFADPTTYTYHSDAAEWQRGTYEQLGLPSGPNAREIYLSLHRRVSDHLDVQLDARDRRRHDDSFPMPNSTDLAAYAQYAIGNHDNAGLSYHYYKQLPFPVAPGVMVGNGFQPVTEGNYGTRLVIHELDLSFQHFF